MNKEQHESTLEARVLSLQDDINICREVLTLYNKDLKTVIKEVTDKEESKSLSTSLATSIQQQEQRHKRLQAQYKQHVEELEALG